MEYNGISSKINEGDELNINFELGIIENKTQKIIFKTTPIPDFLLKIMKKGLIEYIKEKQRNNN